MEPRTDGTPLILKSVLSGRVREPLKMVTATLALTALPTFGLAPKFPVAFRSLLPADSQQYHSSIWAVVKIPCREIYTKQPI